MSVYRHLSLQVPTISYSILHQAGASVAREDYASTMRELHARVGQETAALTAGYHKSVGETISREAQILRGQLGQYLATPIRSDNQDVQKILTEALGRLQDNLLPTRTLGVTESYEGMFTMPSLKTAVERKLLQEGRQYLHELGFELVKGDEVYESVFHIQGGMNLDIIEHLVRDKLGIYASTHGKHFAESAAYIFSAHNLVFARGGIPAINLRQNLVELVFSFSKPGIEYSRFREGLTATIDGLLSQVSIPGCSLWQRKLGLGRTREFILRFLCGGLKDCTRIVQILHDAREPAFVAETLTRRGALLVKEVIF